MTCYHVHNSAAPAGPPENFEVKPLRGKGTAVTATWDPPDEPNGKIRGEAYNALLFIIQQLLSCLICEEYGQRSEGIGSEELF